MDSYLFERCLVTLIADKAIKKFGNHSNFAKTAFVTAAAPITVWRTLRNDCKNRRNLSVQDACQMANALDIPVETLFWQAHQAIDAGWNLKQDVMNMEFRRGRAKQEFVPIRLEEAMA